MQEVCEVLIANFWSPPQKIQTCMFAQKSFNGYLLQMLKSVDRLEKSDR